MNITTIGIDLAKTSFSLAGSDKHGKIVYRKTVKRNKLLLFIAQCQPCLIGLKPVVALTTGPVSSRSSATRFESSRSSSSNPGAKAARMTITMPRRSVKQYDARISGMSR